MQTEPLITRVCPVQIPPVKFFGVLKWLDGRPLLSSDVPFWQQIVTDAFYTFRPDGRPQFDRTLWGMAKKNMKTLILILTGLYKCNVWVAAGTQGQPVLSDRQRLGPGQR